MAEKTASKFACTACGAQYAWKEQLAGRKAKCKCGQIMLCPAEDPAAAPVAADVQEDLYDFADAPAMTIKPAPRQATPVAGRAQSVAAPASPMLGYASTAPQRGDSENDQNAINEMYIPIGVLVVGLILAMVQSMHFNVLTLNFQGALAMIGMRLAIDMVLICIGCLASIKLLDISFGAPGPALLKIAAIALAGPPIGQIISYLIHDPFGIIGSIIAMAIIWVLFVKLFDMDVNDVIMLSAIVWVARMWAGYAILAFILSGMGVSFGGMGGPKLGQAAINSDRIARDTLDLGRNVDGKAWLEESTNHLFGNTPNTPCLKFVNDLIANGCKMPQVLHSGGQADELIAELPSDEAKRKKIFAATAAFSKEFGAGAEVDEGQTFLVMSFYRVR